MIGDAPGPAVFAGSGAVVVGEGVVALQKEL